MAPKWSAVGLQVVGAAVGGLVGVVGYFWLLRQGYYALVLPTGLVGVGCGQFARRPSTARGVICALLGFAAGFTCEWKSTIPLLDKGLGEVLGQLGNFQPVTWLMLGLGTALSFWMGQGVRPGGGGRDEGLTPDHSAATPTRRRVACGLKSALSIR